MAAETCHYDLFQYIFEKLEDNNLEDINYSGKTPLHIAAENGHLSLCQLIIENVTVKNPKDKDGRTPLHLSAKRGHLQVYRMLLEYAKKDILKIYIPPKDKEGFTPLDLAAKNGHFSMYEII